MLEKITQNIELLSQIYGGVPSFRKVDIVALEISYGRYVSLRVRLLQRGLKMPRKWQDFNTVAFSIKFSGVQNCKIQMCGEELKQLSLISLTSLSEGMTGIIIEGQINCELAVQSAYADNFAPALLGDDEQPHVATRLQ